MFSYSPKVYHAMTECNLVIKYVDLFCIFFKLNFHPFVNRYISTIADMKSLWFKRARMRRLWACVYDTQMHWYCCFWYLQPQKTELSQSLKLYLSIKHFQPDRRGKDLFFFFWNDLTSTVQNSIDLYYCRNTRNYTQMHKKYLNHWLRQARIYIFLGKCTQTDT